MRTGRPNTWAGRSGHLSLASCGAVIIAVAMPGLSVAEPQPTLPDVQQQVDELHHQGEQAAERYNVASDKLAELQRQVAAAQADVERQKAKVVDLTRVMGGFAAASYRTGAMDPAMQVLLAEDPGEFLTQASVVDAYATQQVRALRLVAIERQRLAEHQVTATEQMTRLKKVEATLKEEQQTFEDKLAKAQALLDTLKAEERAALERERAAREAASRSAARETLKQNPAAVATGDPSSVPASGKGAIAVKFALAQVGEPYVYGGAGPDSWDCSGLTMMAWREAGVSLPHGAKAQLAVGPQISVGDLQPGDLVYYYSPIGHNGMYVGDGKIVHATHPGDVVSIDALNSMPLTAASRPG